MTWIDMTNSFTIEFLNSTAQKIESVRMHVIGTYSYFPFFFTGKKDTIICNFDFVKILASKCGLFRESFVRYHVFIKLKDKKLLDSVLSALENLEGISPTEIHSGLLHMDDLVNSIEMKIFWMEINSNVFTAIITIIISILLYTGTRIIVQSKENGLARALGLKSFQNIRLHTIESFILLLSGEVIGVVTGLLVTSALLTLGNSFFTIPPLILIVPVFQLLIIFTIILIISVLFNALLLRYFDKADISRLLKTI